MEPSSAVFGWAILAATALSPVLAVVVTRIIDERRDKKGRQMYVFREIISHRAFLLSANFVSALNLIEVEFYGEPIVLEKRKMLMSLLDNITDSTSDAHFLRIEKARVELYQAMGAVLGYKISELDLERGAYSPKGWRTREDRQDRIQILLDSIARGDAAFPVTVVPPSEVDPETVRRVGLVQSGELPMRVEIVARSRSE